MEWTKRQKKALRAEIALWRKNAVKPDADDYESIIMSEWPLCSLFAKMNTCEGCPVHMKTRRAHCDGTPIRKAINTWDEHADGEVSVGGLSQANTEAADWLEDEVLGGAWSYKERAK